VYNINTLQYNYSPASLGGRGRVYYILLLQLEMEMNKLVFGLVLTWNWLLQSAGWFVGICVGGLILGVIKALRDMEKMQMYLKYHSAAARALKNDDKEPM
jgi:hypothetical protein